MCDLFATSAGLMLVDQSGIQVGIDRHLLAGHGVEGESCRYFGGADCAVADYQILNRDQGQEQYEADYVVATDYELTEGFDDVSRCGCAFTAVQQNPATTGKIQRQAQ